MDTGQILILQMLILHEYMWPLVILHWLMLHEYVFIIDYTCAHVAGLLLIIHVLMCHLHRSITDICMCSCCMHTGLLLILYVLMLYE